MANWGRRVRAAIGIGFTWAIAWGFAGGLLARVGGINTDLPLGLLFAPPGLVAGIIFSGIVVAIEGRRKSASDRIPLSRFAGWGALSGLVLSGLFLFGGALGSHASLGEILVFGFAPTFAGAACAAGTLSMARRGETRELPGARRAVELTDNEQRELPGRGE